MSCGAYPSSHTMGTRDYDPGVKLIPQFHPVQRLRMSEARYIPPDGSEELETESAREEAMERNN